MHTFESHAFEEIVRKSDHGTWSTLKWIHENSVQHALHRQLNRDRKKGKSRSKIERDEAKFGKKSYVTRGTIQKQPLQLKMPKSDTKQRHETSLTERRWSHGAATCGTSRFIQKTRKEALVLWSVQRMYDAGGSNRVLKTLEHILRYQTTAWFLP